MSRVPSRFFGLHNHTTFSPMDGLGYPSDHFLFCMENGLDGHALTEHGNMSSYAHAQLWVEKYNKERGDKPPFLFIPGVEGYYHPDLEQWARDKELAEHARDDKAVAKKLAKKQEDIKTKIVAIVDANDETEDFESNNALTIEDEDET